MTKALTLQELFDAASKNAKRIFEESEDHEVLPMWHVVAGNGDNILVATPWSDDKEKANALEGMQFIFRKHQAKRFAFIVEAWIATLTPTEQSAASLIRGYQGPRPSEHPDRREVLMIRAEDRDGTSIAGFYYILRPEHGPPKLSDLKVQDYDQMAGRMTGLLT